MTDSSAGGFGLVADIGGTNARFACVDTGGALSQPMEFAVADYRNVFAAADEYFARIGVREKPGSAVFAVAGPVADGEIRFTNSGWHIAEKEMQAQFGTLHARLINDFEAVVRAIPELSGADIMPVGPMLPDRRREDGTLAALGPGTGLGVAALAIRDRKPVPVAGEGGHASFAPADDLEIEILEILARKFGHVSTERLLSGAGLVNLHDALAEIEGATPHRGDPREITQLARSAPGSVSARAFKRFCAILGSVAGDLALITGAKNGVFLAGGILPDVRDIFDADGFRARFEAKGRFRDYLSAIPTAIVLDPQVGLRGAATLLAKETG